MTSRLDYRPVLVQPGQPGPVGLPAVAEGRLGLGEQRRARAIFVAATSRRRWPRCPGPRPTGSISEVTWQFAQLGLRRVLLGVGHGEVVFGLLEIGIADRFVLVQALHLLELLEASVDDGP